MSADAINGLFVVMANAFYGWLQLFNLKGLR